MERAKIMTTELANPQKCIVLRNGLEIWIDSTKATQIEDDWISGRLKGPLRIEGRIINTADISAIALPGDMYDLSHRKNGQWKCQAGRWHDRGEKCNCPSLVEQDYMKRRAEAIKNCKRGCDNGYVKAGNGMRFCECISLLAEIKFKKP